MINRQMEIGFGSKRFHFTMRSSRFHRSARPAGNGQGGSVLWRAMGYVGCASLALGLVFVSGSVLRASPPVADYAVVMPIDAKIALPRRAQGETAANSCAPSRSRPSAPRQAHDGLVGRAASDQGTPRWASPGPIPTSRRYRRSMASARWRSMGRRASSAASRAVTSACSCAAPTARSAFLPPRSAKRRADGILLRASAISTRRACAVRRRRQHQRRRDEDGDTT